MSTLPQMLWKSVRSLDSGPIPPVALGYFHGLSQDEAHEVVLSIFEALSSEENINRAFLARRLDKSPEQITRWLGAAGNWTLDTYTNLLLAMGHKPTFGAERLSEIRQSNDYHPSAIRGAQGNYSNTANSAGSFARSAPAVGAAQASVGQWRYAG